MMVKAVAESWTEAGVLRALEDKHPAGQWTFVTHVPDATGSLKRRTADALAMGCWSSVGICLHGYEVKVSRSDWQREIQDVMKAQAISQYCHYWWIAAPDGVVKVEEMPANWGLQVVSKKADGSASFRVKKAATRNPTAALDYDFLAAIMRKCKSDNKGDAEIDKRLRDARDKSYQSGKETAERIQEPLVAHIKKENEQLKADMQVIFDLLGKDRWNKYRSPEFAKEAGAAIRYYFEHGCPLDHLKQIQASIDYSVKGVKDAIARLETSPTPATEV